MTKRWSSVRSDLTKSKRQASKERRVRRLTQDDIDLIDRAIRDSSELLYTIDPEK